MSFSDDKTMIMAEEKINSEDKDLEQEMTSPEDGEQQEQQEGTEQQQEQQEPDPLAAAEAEVARLKDKYLRTVAEFDNYRKRTLKEKADLILNGGEKTITAILPVLDDMERAIANGEKTDDINVIREGMTLIYDKFIKTLEGMGVKKIVTEGADFNTDIHEAIAMLPGMGEEKKGKVLDCVQAGYMLNDKVIRHAKVAVGN